MAQKVALLLLAKSLRQFDPENILYLKKRVETAKAALQQSNRDAMDKMQALEGESLDP